MMFNIFSHIYLPSVCLLLWDICSNLLCLFSHWFINCIDLSVFIGVTLGVSLQRQMECETTGSWDSMYHSSARSSWCFWWFLTLTLMLKLIFPSWASILTGSLGLAARPPWGDFCPPDLGHRKPWWLGHWVGGPYPPLRLGVDFGVPTFNSVCVNWLPILCLVLPLFTYINKTKGCQYNIDSWLEAEILHFSLIICFLQCLIL
jgi:hypothetical protein